MEKEYGNYFVLLKYKMKMNLRVNHSIENN